MHKNELLEKLKSNFDSNTIAEQIALILINSCNNIGNKYINSYILNHKIKDGLYEQLCKIGDWSIQDLQNLFEESIDNKNKVENGVVYTPKYIVDYIINETIDFNNIENKNVIDPSCGCGAFLIGFIEKLSENDSINLVDFISNHLYGIDLNESTKSEIELLINIQLLMLNKSDDKLKINIFNFDTLFNNWHEKMGVKFDYIIGNPPYVKVQNMDKLYVKKLKETYDTTKSGGFNLFYAFIEKCMKEINKDGKLGFIVPNNFLKIKSGLELRNYIKRNNYLDKIVDFGSNMVFAPVMTYNCIIKLSKNKVSKYFEYSVIEKTENIQKSLLNAKFNLKNISHLEDEHWLLLSDDTLKKIKMIERFDNKIGSQIRTGIATLRDKLYIIDKEKSGKFYITYQDKEYEIESDLVRTLYKVSDIKDVNNINQSVKYIIFPYYGDKNKPIPMTVDYLSENYPKTFKYFNAIKSLLDERNMPNAKVFYEYGRSQGINNFGKKLMYSQFLGKPKFIYCDDKQSFICNGFAIYEDNRIDIKVLQKILQSNIMDFYIKNSSYSIEGEFYCYQKKYLKKFSYPTFSKEKLKILENLSDPEDINSFLEKIYFEIY